LPRAVSRLCMPGDEPVQAAGVLDVSIAWLLASAAPRLGASPGPRKETNMNQHVGKRFINRSGKTAEVQPTITKADAGPVTGGVCVDVKPLAAAEIRVGGNGSMCGHCGMGPYATLLEAYTHVTSVHTMLPGKPPGLCVETGCLKGQSLPYTLCDAHLVAKGFRPAPALPFSESIAR